MKTPRATMVSPQGWWGRRLLLPLAMAVGSLAGVAVSGCASSVNDLLAEVDEQDPESVRETVIRLADLLAAKEQTGRPLDEADRAAVDLLKARARSDPEPMTRACAISGLTRLKSPDATDTFIGAVEDSAAPWVVRLEAARGLTAHPDPRATPVLARRLETEDRIEVRMGIVKALRAVRGDEALKALLGALLDRSLRYRSMKLGLYDAVRDLSGTDLPLEDSDGWRKLYDERFPAGRSAPPGAAGAPGSAAGSPGEAAGPPP